jgi:hypothetical protein
LNFESIQEGLGFYHSHWRQTKILERLGSFFGFGAARLFFLRELGGHFKDFLWSELFWPGHWSISLAEQFTGGLTSFVHDEIYIKGVIGTGIFLGLSIASKLVHELG